MAIGPTPEGALLVRIIFGSSGLLLLLIGAALLAIRSADPKDPRSVNHLPLRDRIQAAADTIGEARRVGTAPATIIETLRRDHAAAYRVGASTNTLRVAGITASCTWSKDTGLLDAWTRLATTRLMQMNADATA